MKDEIYQLINKYGKVIAQQEELASDDTKIYLKVGHKIYVTDDSVDIGNINEEDIILADDAQIECRILRENDKINGLVVSNTAFLARTRNEGSHVYAVVDDMAQIVGAEVKIVDYNYNDIKKALKKSAGVMVKERYTITTGRTLYEAVVALTVLEKSAEINLKASVIGGGKRIPKIEAILMREIYKKNYSKGEMKWKTENEN